MGHEADKVSTAVRSCGVHAYVSAGCTGSSGSEHKMNASVPLTERNHFLGLLLLWYITSAAHPIAPDKKYAHERYGAGKDSKKVWSRVCTHPSENVIRLHVHSSPSPPYRCPTTQNQSDQQR